jgi:hypothetical protein
MSITDSNVLLVMFPLTYQKLIDHFVEYCLQNDFDNVLNVSISQHTTSINRQVHTCTQFDRYHL